MSDTTSQTPQAVAACDPCATTPRHVSGLPTAPADAASGAGNLRRHVLVETGMYVLEGTIDPDDDLDDRFLLIEDGTGERLWVNGWLADSIEDWELAA